MDKLDIIIWIVGGAFVVILGSLKFIWSNLKDDNNKLASEMKEIRTEMKEIRGEMKEVRTSLNRMEGAFYKKECCVLTSDQKEKKSPITLSLIIPSENISLSLLTISQ